MTCTPFKSHLSEQTLNTEEDAKAFEGEAEAVVIGLFASVDSAPVKAFMATANGIDRLPFAVSSSEEVGHDLRHMVRIRIDIAVTIDVCGELD